MSSDRKHQVSWITRKPRGLGNFSIETSYRTMHAAWPEEDTPPAIHTASQFTSGILDRWRIWQEVRKLRHPILHITGDIHFGAIRMQDRCMVLTIHDLGMLDEGNALARWVKRLFWLEWPLKSCDRVIAVSQRTKEDILSRTNYPAERIKVIPSVISPTYQPRTKGPENAVPRILHIGLAENKNLERHAQALSGLGIHLRIIGEPSEAQHAMLRSCDLEYSHASRLSEEALQDEYASSDLMLFASTLEGFGMPIIEAQTIGVPVITSRLAPMDETAGDGAVLVDPLDVQDIRNAVQRVLTDAALRTDLVSKGRVNAQRFSASEAARKHAELYRELLSEQKG